MKYYKTSKFAKAITSTGAVVTIACLLIAVGAIGWFALSRKNSVKETPQDNNSSVQSYPQSDNSYNDNTNNELLNQNSSEEVGNAVSDVPYGEDDVSQTAEPEKPTFVLPVTGNILKGYSDTALQYSTTYGDMRIHTGIDILCDTGTDIKSAGAGTVKSISEDALLGKKIEIEHTGGICVMYCGFGSVNVKENDSVSAGDIIGTSGEIPSECADNPHIHLEVLVDGNYVSPLETLGLE